jgi:hypothetical protein
MDNLIIQKINEGDSGSVAATKIYKNDKKLVDAVTALKDYLDSYGALVQITTSGGTIEIKTEPGESNTGVMTQKATTDFVYNEVDDMCKVGPTIEGGIQMPESGCYVNVWVSRASMNAEGNSLTILYDDVQELKNLTTIISEMQTKITDLEDRVARLENPNA